jgi:hypothetical protein
MAQVEREVVVGGYYRHFKGGMYLVKGVATHTESEERLVIYQALYRTRGLYARPYEMFVEKVDRQKYPDAAQEYRFELTHAQDQIQ